MHRTSKWTALRSLDQRTRGFLHFINVAKGKREHQLTTFLVSSGDLPPYCLDIVPDRFLDNARPNHTLFVRFHMQNFGPSPAWRSLQVVSFLLLATSGERSKSEGNAKEKSKGRGWIRSEAKLSCRTEKGRETAPAKRVHLPASQHRQSKFGEVRQDTLM